MKSAFKRNLIIGFGFSLALLLLTGTASYVSINNLLQSAKHVDDTHKVIKDLDNILSLLMDAETSQRGYLLSNDSIFLEPYLGARENIEQLIDDFHAKRNEYSQQQAQALKLKQVTTKRLDYLEQLIVAKNNNQPITLSYLKEGKRLMDDVRNILGSIKDEEEHLLAIRTASMNQVASYTPGLIILASLLSILITLVSYLRVSRDFEQRVQLQKELEHKDIEINKRIDIIKGIAEKVSAGDYKIRVNANEKDALGELSVSLNKMAESLHYSFGLLSDKEWLQTGIAGLNDTMVGEKETSTLAYDVLSFLTTYTGSTVGAFYLLEQNQLVLESSIALSARGNSKFNVGEGLVGQCVLNGHETVIQNVADDQLIIKLAEGGIKPRNIMVFPIYQHKTIKGVVEMGTLNEYKQRDIEFIKAVSHNIGVSISTAQNRKRLQELLEETQTQAEELQSQHSELEGLNAEMEMQTNKLQASEEELKVQQEELMQANQELEEKTRLLEEKNQFILERNLEIQRKAEELSQSTKYKSEFLANMSHELRTPLNSILLLSRLMSENNEQNLTEDQIEYAHVIQSSGNGLLMLIDEILDLSKIEAGKMDLEYADVYINDIVGDMQSLFIAVAKEKNLPFNTSISTSVPATISTDKMRLEQILKNLLSNALKFTAQGFVSLEILPNEDDDYIDFTVRDSGIGIAEEKQALIFEAFQQADGSTRRKYGGTGLGLSISKELSKLLGGDIQLVSAVGEGSAFTVIIPKSPNSKPKNLKENGSLETKNLSTELLAEAPAPRKFIAADIPAEVDDDRKSIQQSDRIILIVEDDIHFANALLTFTRKRGYKGIVSVRGDQALELAKAYKPVGILLDIVLPVRSGWEVMDELKADAQTRHIPVHIMSSLEAKKESIKMGAVDFINKPLALDQMHKIFTTLENSLNRGSRKVVILEENSKHAEALAYFLQNFNITVEVATSVSDSAVAIKKGDVDCVILDMGIPAQTAYETLEIVKKNPDLENLPVIIFTGKNLSKAEESRIKQYADSIIVKTAHSYQRILDEAALFLHLMEENLKPNQQLSQFGKLGALKDVLRDKKVLIADDDVRNIYSITKALEVHKMKTIAATDGNEALRILDENPDVDLILMDMMMPEMDGYESTTKIRQNPKYRHLPILAVTAKAMMGDREKCISAGASDYISKPVDMDQLISLLRVWLYDKGF